MKSERINNQNMNTSKHGSINYNQNGQFQSTIDTVQTDASM
mgnify:CR=1 FL=1